MVSTLTPLGAVEKKWEGGSIEQLPTRALAERGGAGGNKLQYKKQNLQNKK